MRITEKGQVTIPITLRRRYGLQRNVEVEFVADTDGIRIKKRGAGAANPFHALRGKGRKRLDVDRYIESVRGR
jgi:bifunctional DNA-binding transcriptional regulator/antitoxin component of YhaV-PrlF toxin-antitoxin module